MFWQANRLGVAALALVAISASSCSCGEGESLALSPKFELIGDAVVTDSTASAHYAIDFGMVTVGSKAAPEIFIRNGGTTRLNVTVKEFEQIVAPFALNIRTLDLQTNEKRQVEFSVAPREVGPFETTITLETNEKNGVKTIRLFGVAIQSQLDCTPKDVIIGEVVKGESRTTTVTCTNNLPIPTSIVLGDFVGSYQKYFSAELQAGNGKTVEIASGESVTIQVGFHADGNITGSASVTLPIYDPSKQPMETLTVSAIALEHALQVRYDEGGTRLPLVGCYKFPDTDLGMSEERTLYVRNLSNNPIHIENLSLLNQGAHFSIVSPSVASPILVPPNGEEEIEVVLGFHPESAQNHTNRLIIQSDDFLEPEGGVGACIEGQGGGARIACHPSQIDFGPVAIGMAVHREYTCTNNAQVREGSIPQILYLDDREPVTTDSPKFSAEVVNPNSHGYAVGDEFTVRVSYTPDEETLDVALIIVNSSASATPKHETRVSGQGRDLPNCDYTLSPSNLRFGVVAPGTQRSLTAYVENLRDTECIISNLRLGEGTHEAFEMDTVESVIIPGRNADPELVERYPITVVFAPSEYGTFDGSVDFFISNVDEPERTIGITGISQAPCIEFDPELIDFGAAPPTCAGREVFVSVANTCTSTLTIDDIFIDEAYPQFFIRSSPIFPLELKGGDRFEFSLYFQPETEGDHRGAVEVEVFEAGDGTKEPLNIGPYLLELMGTGTYDAVQTDIYVQKDNPKVDVLWVIDNSGSMSSSHALIQAKVPTFMQFAVEQGIDFHVGITTSGVQTRGTPCTPKTGFSQNEDGRLVPHPTLNRPRILKSSMSREYLFEHFRNNIDVGTCHGTEAMYQAAMSALSDPHINNPIDDPVTAGNQGFMRRDASLSIILVTDEDDIDSWWEGVSSDPNRSPARYVEFFQSLKPSKKKESVKVHAISGGTTGCSTPWAMACPRCLEGPNLTGGVWLDICTPPNDPGWDDGFREMSQGAFGFDSAFGLRGVPADRNGDHVVDDKDMEVRVAGRGRPAVSTTGARIWRYNSDNNSVSFTPLYVPGPSQEIEVTYKVACMSYKD